MKTVSPKPSATRCLLRSLFAICCGFGGSLCPLTSLSCLLMSRSEGMVSDRDGPVWLLLRGGMVPFKEQIHPLQSGSPVPCQGTLLTRVTSFSLGQSRRRAPNVRLVFSLNPGLRWHHLIRRRYRRTTKAVKANVSPNLAKRAT